MFLFSLPNNKYTSLLQHTLQVAAGLGGGVVWVSDPVTTPQKHGNFKKAASFCCLCWGGEKRLGDEEEGFHAFCERPL